MNTLIETDSGHDQPPYIMSMVVLEQNFQFPLPINLVKNKSLIESDSGHDQLPYIKSVHFHCLLTWLKMNTLIETDSSHDQLPYIMSMVVLEQNCPSALPVNLVKHALYTQNTTT